MYQENIFCTPPLFDAVLWRYTDFTKYVSLLDRSALFFARADRLGDPFEGSYSKINTATRPTLYQNEVPDFAVRQLADFIYASRQFTMISCWHQSEHESAAMWKLYSRERDGVAINTDFRCLSKSFIGEDSINISNVRYVDYDTTFIPENNTLSPYLHKRKSFEHEREVRALTQLFPSDGEKMDVSLPQYSIGKYQPVELSVLIKEIVVAPFAEDWFIELVTSVAEKYGLRASVRQSTLSATPVWR